MSSKNESICKHCGKPYKVCKACIDIYSWKNACCSPECYREYVKTIEGNKVCQEEEKKAEIRRKKKNITKEEAKEECEECKIENLISKEDKIETHE